MSRVEAELEEDMEKVTHEESDIHALVSHLNHELQVVEQRLLEIERREQEVSRLERRIEHGVDLAAKEELDLLQTMHQIGSSIARIEQRLESLERKIPD